MTPDTEIVAGGDGSAVVILLHGRGADRSDMQGLAGVLPRAWTYVLPNAPHAAAAWGYGPGYAWYRFLGTDRPDPETFATSLASLDELIMELPAQLGATPRVLVLGGFSQGGTLGLGYALSRPGRIQGVLNLSGFLPVHEEVRLDGASAQPPVFWGHGTQDPSIPFVLAVAGRRRLEAAGVPLESHDYPIGHWIDEAEIVHAASFLERLRTS